ncbi:MAG: hypothetical protein DCC58_16745 [Chloroflexi bacterium]|nr:MAG: hypothetical protein DCC58_16745 [Chloroflexota bacterium]
MSDSSSPQRPKLSRKRTWLTALVLLVVVVVGVEVGARFLFAPWSIGWFGGETLTGEWVGPLQARLGAEYALYLELEYRRPVGDSSSSSGPRNNLEGRATLCTPLGERYDYEVSGRANRSGKVEVLWLEYGDPSLSALNLRLTGKWDAPNLAMQTAWPDNPFLPDGSFIFPRTVSSADPDDSFLPWNMTAGSTADLDALCARIAQ